MDLHYGSHPDHFHQLRHESTPPPAPSTHEPLMAEVEEESAEAPTFLPALSLGHDGTLRKHRQEAPPTPAWSHPHGRRERRRKNSIVVYGECMRNHAAALGGHALDGCGEFMPCPASNPSAPASLTCVACGCHRNFHRRLPHRDEGDVGRLGDRGDDMEGPRPSPPPPLPQKGAGFNTCSSSAPRMLMALSTVYHGTPAVPAGSPPLPAGTTSGGGTPTGAAAGTLPGKRFRTKFTPEQKARMQGLCEQLGWRMQRRDDALVEQRCREIGVSRGVFKVWMHNNKHAFVGGPSSRRGSGGAGCVSTADEATSCGEPAIGGGGSCVVDYVINGDSGDGGSTGHAAADASSPVSSELRRTAATS